MHFNHAQETDMLTSTQAGYECVCVRKRVKKSENDRERKSSRASSPKEAFIEH